MPCSVTVLKVSTRCTINQDGGQQEQAVQMPAIPVPVLVVNSSASMTAEPAKSSLVTRSGAGQFPSASRTAAVTHRPAMNAEAGSPGQQDQQHAELAG
jgi:hypothetical protein